MVQDRSFGRRGDSSETQRAAEKPKQISTNSSAPGAWKKAPQKSPARQINQVPLSRTPPSAFGSEATDEDLFRLYVGPNAIKFMRFYRALAEKENVISFNWFVFLTPMSWLFYRKLYGPGIFVMSFPIISVMIFPKLADMSFTVVVVVMAFLANSYYVRTATRCIDKLRALDLPPGELEERIRRAGGTSIIGAIFATVIYASLIALKIMI